MPEAIKKSDIIEGKILDGFIQELTEVTKLQNTFNSNLKETAKLTKGGLLDSKTNSSNSIAEQNRLTKEANDLLKQKQQLDKNAIDVAKKLEQLQREKLKTQNAVNRENEREVKVTEKLTRTQQALQSQYSKVQGHLTRLKEKYRDLAIQKELGFKLSVKEEAYLLSAEKSITKYDTALKKVDAQMGMHQRNVGNYASGFNGLGNSVNQLTREMPAFANSMQTGFMAISNNLPIFFDEISKIKTANKELIAQGQPVKSTFAQIGASIFSVGTLLSVGVTLLTVYGAKIIKWVSSLSTANVELERQAKIKARLNKESKDQADYVGKESSNYVGLIHQLKQTNVNSKERFDLIKEINKEYGTTLENIQNETLFQDQLNKSIDAYILSKRIEFKIKKNEETRQKIIALQEINDLELNKAKKATIEQDALVEDMKRGKAGNIFYAQQKLEKLQRQQKELEDDRDYYERRQVVLAGGDIKLTEQKSGLGFDEDKEKTNHEKVKEIQDLSRAIEDEKIKRINDESRRIATALIVQARRDIEDVDKSNAKEEQKAEYRKQINKTLYNDLIKLDKQYIIEQDKIEAEYWAKVKSDNKTMYDFQYELALKEIETEAMITETALENSKKFGDEKKKIELENEIDILEQKLELAKSFGKKEEQLKLELELAKLKNENGIKKDDDLLKSLNKLVKFSADYFIAQSERKIKQLDKEIAQHEKAQSNLLELAKNGNIQASQSLAVEQQQIVEANKKKEKEARRIARLKLIESGFSAYANNGSVVKTITDLTVLSSALNALAPAFFDGTEDTGTNGNGIDGIGGFHAILHPNERVMTKEQNAMLGGMKNDEVAETIAKVRSGETVNVKGGATAINTNWTNLALISEIQDLKNIIKNKPEQNIELGKINQRMMEIIDTKIQGNTTRRNIHIVR